MPRQPDRERIQKYLATLGISSRRKIEDWIRAGRITIDGRTAELGDRVSPGCRIAIDGRPVRSSPERTGGSPSSRVILYNKPEGEICSRSDPRGRPTVFNNLPTIRGGRWISIGRLDINTRGLLLFTNDGALANRLMHPSTELEREYLCRVFGDPTKADIKKLTEGIEVDNERLQAKLVRRQKAEGSNNWYRVVLTEGRNREVRRLFEAIGCRVNRLNRVRYGKIALPRGMKPGGWVELDQAAVDHLIRNRSTDSVMLPKAPRNRSRKGQGSRPARRKR